MAATKGRSEGTEASFDERLARLEAIVNELEHGGIALEPAIERYQEGIALLKDCRTILSGFKQRVEELSASADASARPYDGDPDANAPGANGPGAGRSSAQ